MRITIYNDGNRYCTKNEEPATVHEIQMAIASLIATTTANGLTQIEAVEAVLLGLEKEAYDANS